MDKITVDTNCGYTFIVLVLPVAVFMIFQVVEILLLELQSNLL